MRFLLSFFILFTLPLQAQEMLPEYNIVGYIDFVMEGKETRLPVVTMPDKGTTFARKSTVYEKDGIDRITITGVTPREDGHWQFPMVEILITTHRLEILRSIFIRYSVEPFRNDYAFTAGTGKQTAIYGDFVTDDNGLVEFAFRGQLVHYDRDPETAETTPQAGKNPVEISGKVHVVIPEEFRE